MIKCHGQMSGITCHLSSALSCLLSQLVRCSSISLSHNKFKGCGDVTYQEYQRLWNKHKEGISKLSHKFVHTIAFARKASHGIVTSHETNKNKPVFNGLQLYAVFLNVCSCLQLSSQCASVFSGCNGLKILKLSHKFVTFLTVCKCPTKPWFVLY